jgi:phage terminase large subunit GpA-like protein
MVRQWAECWDIGKNRLRDKEKYRLFRNTKQGLTFEEGGVQIQFERVTQFRRTGFVQGKVPNDIALEDTGSVILFLAASVDVQNDCLYVDVKGYSDGGATWTIDFFEIKGNTGEFNGVWDKLDMFLGDKRYIGTDEKIYPICITLIDSGHNAEYVYEFTKRHLSGVYACKGKDWFDTGETYRFFSPGALEKTGMPLAFHINTGKLKDRISNSLMRSFWKGAEYQPYWYPNFPEDFRDDYFRMFEAETKQEKRDPITQQFRGYVWKLAFGQPNHALDTYVYNLAGLEVAAEYCCRYDLDLPALDWTAFWEYAKTGVFYEDGVESKKP